MAKVCTGCRQEKAEQEFRKENRSKDGLSTRCKECMSQKSKQYYSENKAEFSRKARIYYKKHALELNARAKASRSKYAEGRRHIDKIRRRECPKYAATIACRNRVSQAFRRRGYTKRSKAFEMIGCSAEYLKAHLESLFSSGMTWENRGVRGWHIDHKIPLASAKTIEDLERLCHYSNLQPLWFGDNLAKRDSLQWEPLSASPPGQA